VEGVGDILGGWLYCLKIPADLARVPEAREWIGHIGRSSGLSGTRVFDLQAVDSDVRGSSGGALRDDVAVLALTLARQAWDAA
jgi:hypothetical protein